MGIRVAGAAAEGRGIAYLGAGELDLLILEEVAAVFQACVSLGAGGRANAEVDTNRDGVAAEPVVALVLDFALPEGLLELAAPVLATR
jgi:hypothetical protein